MNLTTVLEVAVSRTPDRAAIVQGDTRVSYRQLQKRALRVAGLLSQAGLERGDRVALLLSNCVEFTEISLGAIGSGGVLTPINTRLAPPEISYVMADSRARYLFVGAEFLPQLEAFRSSIPADTVVIVVGEANLGDGLRSYEDEFAAAASLERFVSSEPDDDCIIVYTSGTTGRPKGAVRSHGGCLANAQSMTQFENCGPTDSFIFAVPLASAGYYNLFVPMVMRSFTIHLLPKFDASEFLRLLAEERCTHTYLVPSMWDILLNAPECESADTSSLRWGIWGGEPMADALRQRIVARFGHVLAGIWGATESGLSVSSPEDGATRPGTAGRASGLNQLRIVDDLGNEVPRGQVGEIINKGPGVMLRYLSNPEATADAIRDGWYYSGDLATMDDDGYVTIVDRKREMLISGGQNVYPAEIEAALREHPDVVRVAVVGVPDAKWGEAPVAFVVWRDSANEDDLREWCRARLAGYKIPRFWHAVDELPTNANGKIRKNDLRQQAVQLAAPTTAQV